MAKVTDAIISIRPIFAEAILSGLKTVELRRRIPPIEVGTRLWIYATRPVAAVIGSAIVDQIIRGTPEYVWESCASGAGLGRRDFDAYFGGAAEAVGLTLTKVRRAKPIEMEQLRSVRNGFHPPQVIAKLTLAEAISLKALAREAKQSGAKTIRP